MAEHTRGSAVPAAPQGLAHLLALENRLEALLERREAEAADLVAEARRAAEARRRELAQERDTLLSRHREELEEATTARLAEIEEVATHRWGRLAALPEAARRQLVEQVVAKVVNELGGGGQA